MGQSLKFSERGRRCSYTTDLPQNDDEQLRHPMLRLEMTNCPAVRGRERDMRFMHVPTRALGYYLAGIDIQHEAFDVEANPFLKQVLTTKIVDFTTFVEVLFGASDMLSPQAALALPELGYMPAAVKEAIEAGQMDVIYVNPEASETGSTVNDRRVSRPRYFNVKLYDLWRTYESDKFGADHVVWLDEDSNRGRRFSSLTGIYDHVERDGRKHKLPITKAIAFGRTPTQNCPPLKEGASIKIQQAGNYGRGYVVVLPLGLFDSLMTAQINMLLDGTHDKFLERCPSPASFNAVDAASAESPSAPLTATIEEHVEADEAAADD